MITVQSLVRRDTIPTGADVRVTLDPSLQGLPDMAHGGTVLALFDAMARRRGPRRLVAHYRRRVPLGVSLRATLAAADDGDAATCRLIDDAGVVLVDGRIERAGESPGVAATATPAIDDGAGRTALPASTRCFVCGTANEAGLHARSAFDDDAVTATWQARETFRAPDGSLSPLPVTALLDEAAFWLGALATGESGMTTELSVTLADDAVFARTVTVVGERRRVVPRPDDPRYRHTTAVALDESGRIVAIGEITFVAVRGAARRLAQALLALNATDVVRRVFPAYVDG